MNKGKRKEAIQKSAGKLRSAIKSKKAAGVSGIIFLSVVTGTVFGIILDALVISLAVCIAVGIIAAAKIEIKE